MRDSRDSCYSTDCLSVFKCYGYSSESSSSELLDAWLEGHSLTHVRECEPLIQASAL